MKAFTITGRVLMAAFLAFTISACSKSKNGSVASTPATATSCTFNGVNYVDQNGAICASGTQSAICPATGINPSTGVACVVGQYIHPGYPYSSTPSTTNYGCDAYYYRYGVRYVPVILNNNPVCLRIDLLTSSSSYQNSYYQDYGYQYFDAYPPYEDDSCPHINLGGYGSIGICF